jgi:phosphoribosyl 1,2-cyclic phosphate phosphodiesterase
MQLQLLGTAAAEGWPAPFCACDACQKARRRGGPNLRTRAGALLDDDFKIDYGPDTLMQLQRSGRCLQTLQTLVFTHQHSDHVAPKEMHWVISSFTNTPPPQIDVYAPEPVVEVLQRELGPRFLAAYDIHALTPLEPVTTRRGDAILPLPADHVAGAVTLLITRQNKKIFYGHDSGLYPAQTLDALEQAGPLDLILMDCTSGAQQTENRNHMSISGVIQMRDELQARGAITPQTRVVATHFSHNGKLSHEELLAHFTPLGIDVAYDGMTLDL